MLRLTGDTVRVSQWNGSHGEQRSELEQRWVLDTDKPGSNPDSATSELKKHIQPFRPQSFSSVQWV